MGWGCEGVWRKTMSRRLFQTGFCVHLPAFVWLHNCFFLLMARNIIDRPWIVIWSSKERHLLLEEQAAWTVMIRINCLVPHSLHIKSTVIQSLNQRKSGAELPVLWWSTYLPESKSLLTTKLFFNKLQTTKVKHIQEPKRGGLFHSLRRKDKCIEIKSGSRVCPAHYCRG